MNCDDRKKDVLLLAAGLLPERQALELERHLAGCRACAALRLAALEERAALREAGAPLLSAGEAFRVVPGRPAAAGRYALALAAAAACFAVFVLLREPPRDGAAPAAAPAMTPAPGGQFHFGEGAAPGPSDFLLELSGRRAAPTYAGTDRS